MVLLSSTHRLNMELNSQSTYRGRVERGGVYLPSQLKEGGRAAPPSSPGLANFSIMMECTPECGHCHSVCTLLLDLPNLFVLHVHSCTHWLRPINPPPPAFGLILRGRFWSAKYRRHFFVTPWFHAAKNSNQRYVQRKVWKKRGIDVSYILSTEF
jgi:hypothetical protein